MKITKKLLEELVKEEFAALSEQQDDKATLEKQIEKAEEKCKNASGVKKNLCKQKIDALKRRLKKLDESMPGMPDPRRMQVNDAFKHVMSRLDALEKDMEALKQGTLNEAIPHPMMTVVDKVSGADKVDKFTGKSASPMAREALRQVSALKKRVDRLGRAVEKLGILVSEKGK